MIPRPSIRLRLTLWYGGFFLLAGILLVAVNFVLVARNFPSDADELRQDVEQRLELQPGDLRGDFSLPLQVGVLPGDGGTGAGVRPANNVGDGDARRGPGGPRGVAYRQLFDGVLSEVESDTLRQLVWQSSAALVFVAFVSIGLDWFVAGRMLRPVHEISAMARRISDERLEERIAVAGPPDELKELADQFDAMLDRLQSAFEAQREFVANTSHELRTPLTIIRTELDVTLDDPAVTRAQLAMTADVVRRAIDRTEGLIDGLLVLARAEGPLQREEEVDLGDAVRRALDARAAEIAELELRVTLELGEASTHGDPMLLERLAGNLVENAVEHNEPGGWVSIVSEQDERGVTLRASNSSSEVPEAELPRLFERFARLERSRTRGRGGYGLGLSIVRAIVRAHRGTATARSLPEGGLSIEVALPR